jgi:hypothetical protein
MLKRFIGFCAKSTLFFFKSFPRGFNENGQIGKKSATGPFSS